MERYNFQAIEKKWQKSISENKLYKKDYKLFGYYKAVKLYWFIRNKFHK